MCRRQEKVAVMAPSWHLTCTLLKRYVHAGRTEQPWARTQMWACEHGAIPNINKSSRIYVYMARIYIYIQKNWYVCFGKKPSWAASLLQTNIQMGPKWKFPTSTSVLFKMLARSAYKKSSYNNVACMRVEGFCFVIFEFVFGALHLQWASSPHDDYI